MTQIKSPNLLKFNQIFISSAGADKLSLSLSLLLFKERRGTASWQRSNGDAKWEFGVFTQNQVYSAFHRRPIRRRSLRYIHFHIYILIDEWFWWIFIHIHWFFIQYVCPISKSESNVIILLIFDNSSSKLLRRLNFYISFVCVTEALLYFDRRLNGGFDRMVWNKYILFYVLKY